MKDPHTDRLVAITAQIFHCLYQALMFWVCEENINCLGADIVSLVNPR